MPEDLIDLLDRRPFESFWIVTSSGERYLIDDPHVVAMMTGRVFVAPKGDRWVFIKIGQIVSLESAKAA